MSFLAYEPTFLLPERDYVSKHVMFKRFRQFIYLQTDVAYKLYDTVQY